MKYLFLPLLFLALKSPAKELELKTTISDVTVFQSGAQVTRTGTVTIPAGESQILIRDATAQLKQESIQVKGDGNFTILSVNYEVNLDDQKSDKSRWANLGKKEKDLLRQMQDLSVKIEVLRTEEAVVMNLQSVSPATEGVTVDQVAKAQDVLQQKLLLIKTEKLTASRKLNELNDEHQKILQELNVIRTPRQSVTYQIVIKVLSKTETKGAFILNYIVPHARWYPTYDLRVKNVSEPMLIEYKANVSQQTGEDWNKVKLKLSTGDPSRSSPKPTLDKWLLYLNQPYVQPKVESNYYKYTDAKLTRAHGQVLDKKTGEPLPFCTVSVEGTNVGTSTDIDGNFNIVLPENASQLRIAYIGYKQQVLSIRNGEMKIYLETDNVSLQEVEIVTGKEPASYNWSFEDGQNDKGLNLRGSRSDAQAITVTPSVNNVNAEFQILEKYSILSDPKEITVAIQSIESKVGYQYYCAPRLDKDVFLTALMTDWEQYNFLEGQANVFFEGTFIGSTLLDSRYLKDTLEISLGRDKSVQVERKKSKEFNKKQFLSGDNIASREWDLKVRNGKQQKINIIIEDQFPLSTDSRIDVKRGEHSDGKLDDESGIVTWNYNLDPGGTKAMQLKYTAKFPKGNFIGLD